MKKKGNGRRKEVPNEPYQVYNTKRLYVQAERLCTGTETSEYKYCLAYYGNFVMCDISAEDAREIISCLQHALDVNEKGGQNEK